MLGWTVLSQLKQDHSELERDLRGSARVYSKVLVEENKNERTKAR